MDWLYYEKEAQQQGFCPVCGVDEAGRGPLAGPVCAAAVILPPGLLLPGLNDSKKLTEKKREALYKDIVQAAQAWCVAYADVAEIERYNILGASLLAMRRAVEGLQTAPQMALVDGNRDPRFPIPARLIVGGDGKSANIAAASVLAKVSRDRLMRELDGTYPQYGFRKHKGYPTRAHYEAILQYGPCNAHRPSFLKNLEEKRKAFGRA